MREILPGVWQWTAEHPRIGQPVWSYYLEDAGAVVDPMLPEGGVEAFGDWAVQQVILSNRLHSRDTGTIHRELGAICPDDMVLHVRAGLGVLHFADGLHAAGGEPAFMPDELMDEPATVRERTLDALGPLLAVDFDALTFAHSDPITAGGRDQLAAFVSRYRT